MSEYRRLERQHPIFSPVALISTFVLALGLVIGLYFHGGEAFSPGELSAVQYGDAALGGFINHAELAHDCGQCHTPFVGIEATRCETCHENIARERQTAVALPAASGETAVALHGRFPNAAACADCHLEHRGPDYDLKTAAVTHFNHDLTRFSLAKHTMDYEERPLECASCHQETGQFTVTLSACITCHQDADPVSMVDHRQTYGDDCLACHDGKDTLAAFTPADHDQIFALSGVHATTACQQCHVNGQFAGISQECVACHDEPPLHAGIFGVQCAACHTTDAWLPARLLQHNFPLDHGETGLLACAACHPTTYDQYTCTTCHEHEPDEMRREHDDVDFSQTDYFACAECHPTGQEEEHSETD